MKRPCSSSLLLLALGVSTLSAAAVSPEAGQAPPAATPPPPAATAKAAPPAPPAPAPTFAPGSPEAIKRENELRALAPGLMNKGPVDDTPSPTEDDLTFVDPATGQRLVKIIKNPTMYEKNGRLFSAIAGNRSRDQGQAIVRQDETYYYVVAPERKVSEKEGDLPFGAPPIVEVDKQEGEVVEPPIVLRKDFVLQELSDGLPKSGMWRENLAVGDMDKDGKKEIVASSPRMGGQGLSIFKLEAGTWKKKPVTFEGKLEQPSFDYGGVDVLDVDGDGRPDVAFVGHGISPVVSFNKGGYRFSADDLGMARGVWGRTVLLGDFTGDGRVDLVTVSDSDEWKGVEKRDSAGVPELPKAVNGYLKGYNVRSFIRQADGSMKEMDLGLEPGCYAMGAALEVKPKDRGKPFLATGCNYVGWDTVVFEYDKKAKRWQGVARDPVAEQWALHGSAAVGTYRGMPAAFVTYWKGGPQGALPPMKGYGISVYYREGTQWKRKRLLKLLGTGAAPKAIAAGDVDGDGLDDVVVADDNVHRIRIFLQRKDGEFEELDPSQEPTYVNFGTSLKIADLDGDRRNDLVFMYQYNSGISATRAGGIRVFFGKGIAGRK